MITGTDLSAEAQAMRYELACLSFRMVDTGAAVAGVEPWVTSPHACGRLLGCWLSEHGVLGRLFVLRGFKDEVELSAERERTARSRKPFGAEQHLVDLVTNAFAPFPFVPPVQTGEFGSVYEIRDYHLRPGGLPATIEGWRQALPARHAIDPLTVAMYALDGPARIVHIWPFNGLDERIRLRGEAYARGIWPPPGAPDQILDATSTIAWPMEFSPLK
jgi:hypothetical protein